MTVVAMMQVMWTVILVMMMHIPFCPSIFKFVLTMIWVRHFGVL